VDAAGRSDPIIRLCPFLQGDNDLVRGDEGQGGLLFSFLRDFILVPVTLVINTRERYKLN
jgi:hypothetical protein